MPEFIADDAPLLEEAQEQLRHMTRQRDEWMASARLYQERCAALERMVREIALFVSADRRVS